MITDPPGGHVEVQEHDRNPDQVEALVVSEVLQPLGAELDAVFEAGCGDIAPGEGQRLEQGVDPHHVDVGKLSAHLDRLSRHARSDVEDGAAGGRQARLEPLQLGEDHPGERPDGLGGACALGLEQVGVGVLPTPERDVPPPGAVDQVGAL